MIATNVAQQTPMEGHDFITFDASGRIDELIRAATRYRELPARHVVSANTHSRVVVSYGVIAHACDTDRWLLIRRYCSPHFVAMLRGYYRVNELPGLVAGLSDDESDLIRRFLHSEIKYGAVCDNYLNDEDPSHGYRQMIEHGDYIAHLLKTVQHRVNTEWLWPKGRPQHHEHRVGCAEREFLEEAGLSLEPACRIGTEHIVERNHSCNGRLYDTQYWVYEFDVEPPVEQPIGNREVAERRWMTYSQALLVLDSTRVDVLNQASSLIKVSRQQSFGHYQQHPLITLDDTR